MSSFNSDLGTLKWSIDADLTALNAKLDQAEARVRQFGAAISGVIGGDGTATPSQIAGSTFGGIASPAGGGAWGGPGGPAGVGAAPSSVSQSGGSNVLGAVRGIVAFRLGLGLARQAVSETDKLHELNVIMSTGGLDDQLKAGTSYFNGLNSGLTGFIRRQFSYNGVTQDQVETDLANAAKSLSGQGAIDTAMRANRRLRLANSFIGASDFAGLGQGPLDSYLGVEQQAHDLRAVAIKTLGADPRTARSLLAQANGLQETARVGFVQQTGSDAGKYLLQQYILPAMVTGTNTLSQGISLGAQAGVAAIAGTGNAFGAQYAGQQSAYAIQEASQTNPVIRAAMRAAHGVALWSMRAMHETQLGDQTQETESASLDISAEMPWRSIEESSQIKKQAAERRRTQALARYQRENPGDTAGYNAEKNYWDNQVNLIESQGIFASASQAAATRGVISSLGFAIQGDPLESQIASIQGQTESAVLAVGFGTKRAGELEQIGALQQELVRKQWVQSSDIMHIGLGNQRIALGQVLDHNPIGAQSTIAAGSAFVQAKQMQDQGHGVAAAETLQNALLEQKVIKQDYLDAFRATQYDLRENVIGQRDQEDAGKAMESIDKNVQGILDVLRNMGIEQ